MLLHSEKVHAKIVLPMERVVQVAMRNLIFHLCYFSRIFWNFESWQLSSHRNSLLLPVRVFVKMKVEGMELSRVQEQPVTDKDK